MTGKVTHHPGRMLARIAAMAGKEVLHIRRDPRTLYLALVMPVVMLLLFGYGISFDVDHLPLVVADQDQSEASRRLVRAFVAPGEFVLAARLDDPAQAEVAFRRGEAVAALLIPAGYQRAILRAAPERGGAPGGHAQLLVDGADGNTANQVLAKADAVARAESLHALGPGAAALQPPLSVKVWTRYNPEARSALFLVPGLAAFLVAIGAVLLTALTIAVEWERGSMEQLFASPVGRTDIILGKLLPYLVLGMVQFLLVIAVGTGVFDVPIRGSVALMMLLGFTFLGGMLGQGLLISVIAKNQMVATQAGALSTLLPSLLLSGMLFPLDNMPLPLQALSRIVPARYLVHGLREIMLKGQGLAAVWPDVLMQAVFAVLILALATRRFKRRLA